MGQKLPGLLGDTGLPKGYPSPQNSKKPSLGKIYLFKIPPPPPPPP